MIKKIKKVLTIDDTRAKIVKLSARQHHLRMLWKIPRKKFEKTFKKVLTKREDGDIITKLSARAGSELDLEN